MLRNNININVLCHIKSRLLAGDVWSRPFLEVAMDTWMLLEELQFVCWSDGVTAATEVRMFHLPEVNSDVHADWTKKRSLLLFV